MTAARAVLKDQVRNFWQRSSCGEVYATGTDTSQQLAAHEKARYDLEPYILDFAEFEQATGRDVLEIGVGMGADHEQWARNAPRSLVGVDLTPKALEWTSNRLRIKGWPVRLAQTDAERLPFIDGSFDIVYSWGVLHHTPDTPAAIAEVRRVLRVGGEARVMIYHAHSLVGYLLWLRYGLLKGQPTRTLREIYAAHLESPGTKAFTLQEGSELFASFRRVRIRSMLSFGDLLQGQVGQQHSRWLVTTAKRLWPRRLLTALFPRHGLLLLVNATK